MERIILWRIISISAMFMIIDLFLAVPIAIEDKPPKPLIIFVFGSSIVAILVIIIGIIWYECL